VPGNDPSSYYFMEMNTRLQVEHPVTELVTGLDLVEWQLRVAAGERLPFAQDDITLTGHAVEARICAEDPARGFLPSGGTVLRLHEPQGDGIRTDSGLSEGTEVGSLYDPMLSKVIAYGPDRATALRKLGGPRGHGDAGRADERGVPAEAAGPSGGRGGRVGHRARRAGGGLGLVPDEVPVEVYEAAAPYGWRRSAPRTTAGPTPSPCRTAGGWAVLLSRWPGSHP
jgi:acetyl-CoA/propionyl-CoA carboxylase biotin carboxyl carrier protein